MSLGAKIKALREQQQWEISRLAREARLSHSYVYKLEHDERPNVAGVVLKRLADALETTADYLLDRTTDPTPLPTPEWELDLEQAIRLRHFAQRVSRLPIDRQRRVIDLATLAAELAEGTEGRS